MSQIDLSYLNSIGGGDQSFVNEILRMISSNTLPEMQQLKDACNSKKWGELTIIAHKMKAPIQMLGVNNLTELIAEIEQLGKSSTDVDLITNKIVSLEILLHQISAEIEQILQK